MRRQIGFWKLSNFPKKIASLFPRDFVYLNTNNYGNQQFLCKAESGREREDAFIQKEGLGKVSRPWARRQIKQTKTPNPKQKTHMALPWEGLSLKKKWNGRNKKDWSKCRVVQFMNKLTLLLYDGVFRQQSTIQAITRSTGTHTHRHAHRPHPELLYCVFILICNEDKIIYTCTPFKCARSVTMNKRDGVTLWEHRHLSLRVCVGRMNLPLSQQGLNTHRVNIIGLNPGWVDIGLVWVQDFIFLSLTLVFAVSDLNSIGVICLSKARTGTCRSWVGAHCDQGNSIRQHPYSVCGWDSSVDIGGLGLGDSTSGECTISRERVHNGWWEAPQMNAFKNALSAHPGNRSKPYSKGFISSCGSSLYQMASVSSTAPQVSKASFYETNNVLFRRPIYLSYMKEVQTSS